MAAFMGAFLFISTVVAANNCSIQPIYIDFHDRAVDGGVSTQYGLFTGIGFPTSQNLSQWPSLSNNETTVGSLDYCSSSPFTDCINRVHGFYSPELSEAYSSGSSYQSLDDLGSIPATIVETAFDTINLYTHYYDPSPANVTRVPDFPITVLSNYSADSSPWFGPAGLVGLGPSSTVLQHLYDLKLISTRSFGLYMGTEYEQSNGAINGSLTLGGYDSGRFEGEVHNFTISQALPQNSNSPFKVSVAQMTLTAADGEKTELLSNSFDASITTSQYQLNLPGAVADKFADETGATPSNDANNVLRLPDDFDSTLTITLESGLSVTYEAEWLRNVSNNSPISAGSISSSQDNGTTSTEVNLLGSAFLSNVYFMANYDSQPPTFHLALARPHGPYVQTQTLCADTVPTPAPATTISSFAREGITGAIVGGVIGGIGLTFLCWWLLRKWAQRRMWRNQARTAMKGKGIDGVIAVKGKGSPSTSGDEDRDSSEMATFSFDFESQQHQSYQAYLNSQSLQQQAYASKESTNVPQSQDRAQEYLRSRDDAYSSSGPLTPATGVPLLSSQQAPAQSDPIFHPLTLSNLHTPPISSPFAVEALRKSSESTRRQALNLNVQTEFAPPPTTSKNERITRKAVGKDGGKKENLLKKVFPPPSGASGS
ncbi:uncharacterized protein Z518_11343 [Rhinocladiella mackenziei CBS 650.93]|uniref:Peptidase A1 domain-containing protein n=1 Tax=Rhinocladiella mackenziei CBS 650.93 TaxID=1442369 RepID=A0A0D2I7Y5_9EURO|nr:uncharacterized protein Z518_11343 [Rhinocladiella mackenziei CBS 650.93]KIW99355.1 hypothetical protein Z518_11343 [Rhinocladiella mackenziei CBS 650.93]